MMRSLLLLLLCSVASFSQELRATVAVNYEQVSNGNPQLFKNLEKQITEFLNNTKWTDQEIKELEKLECNFFINITSYSNNNFEATLQVQASRPVFNTTYKTSIFNNNDKNFNFSFIEFENLIYDQNTFTSNLVAVLGFYANLIIGFEKDSFSKLGGTKNLTIASNIVNMAQSSGYKGWSQSESGNNNRYFLISDLLSNTFEPFRTAMFQYHFSGLDLMADTVKEGKNNIVMAISTLSEIQKTRPNALLTRTFFDTKADEIVSVFSGGPLVDTADLLQNLNRISPLNSQKWNSIR